MRQGRTRNTRPHGIFYVVHIFLLLVLLLVLTPLSAHAGDTAMYRVYNPNSGEHFYTASAAERNHLVKVGWNAEGIGWYAPTRSAFPVYRLYNPNAGDHHYTLNYGEMRYLKSVGWSYEGIGWYSDANKSVPVYRQYNPNARTGSHNFTVSPGENKKLVTLGWKAEGVAWYGVSHGNGNQTNGKNESAAWKITQYASVTGRQGMFYTIEDNSGRLAIIDGGYTADENQVLAIIRSHGNHVYDWIITHPHPDHVGALNAVLQGQAGGKLTGIRIDHIYTTRVNKERYEATAQDYDGIESFEMFYNLTDGKSNLTYLAENDTADILGLHMKVLHAWDSHVDELSRNLCNDGSLLFLLSGNKNRFLFCGDTQGEMEQYIIPAHQRELQADFVQCGHHGNWGLTTAFYDLVNPKVAFMDAPSYILNDTSGTYDGPELKRYFLNKKVTVYELTGAPNSIEMR